MAPASEKSNLRVLMFPWFAHGHITPYLHLSNELAERGHTIIFLLPNKARAEFQHLNFHPHLIAFSPLTIPSVQGLPEGAETATDIPIELNTHLASAMDLTRPQVQSVMESVKPDLVLYDCAHWIPELARPLGIKTVNFNVVCAAAIAISLVPARGIVKGMPPPSEEELAVPPPGYPSTTVVFRKQEGSALMFLSFPFGDSITFYERVTTALSTCDVVAIRTCHELEGQFCDYISAQFQKPVLLTGPVLPEPDSKATKLEDRWEDWLNRFAPRSVIFCAFGSQVIFKRDQFQEICLGLELTGRPFIAAMKPPEGESTVEGGFPEGFGERVKGRGVVVKWAPQTLILAHKSVGCFVSHCGFGSMWESLMSECGIVLVPQLGDQILNSRLLAEELKVAVEVGKEQEEEEKRGNWVSRERLKAAIEAVMNEGSEVGARLRENHRKWRELLLEKDFTSRYVDKFEEALRDLAHQSKA